MVRVIRGLVLSIAIKRVNCTRKVMFRRPYTELRFLYKTVLCVGMELRLTGKLRARTVNVNNKLVNRK